MTKHHFPNNKLEIYNLQNTDKTSRTGILIHKDIKFKRRKYLERHGISSIWLEIGISGTKTFLFQGLYRQHKRLANNEKNNTQGTKNSDGKP